MTTRSTHTTEGRGATSAWQLATLVAVAAIVLAACSAASDASEPTGTSTTAPSTTSTTRPTTTTATAEVASTQVEARGFEHLSAEQPPETVAVDNAGQVPFYARIEPGHVMHDGEWAMVYLYRPAECIPPDFDLLEFFHLPSEKDPGAFACGPPTADGVGYWENGPETDSAPIKMILDGMGSVPVWFVGADEYREAMEDGLTIEELESLDPRKGTASTFHEILAPGVGLSVSATGELEDGTRFLAQHTSVKRDRDKGVHEVTNIELDG